MSKKKRLETIARRGLLQIVEEQKVVGCQIPPYHMEYKELFQKENQQYELLENYWVLHQVQQYAEEYGVDLTFNESTSDRRWGWPGPHPCVTEDRKPGEIITRRPVKQVNHFYRDY